MGVKKKYSSAEDAILSELYADELTSVVAEKLGRTESSVYQRARAIGLRKSAEFLAARAVASGLAEAGKKCRFEPGLTPWNKGIPFEPGGNSMKTRFKPGDKPKTTLPVGSKRLTKDGIMEVKISCTGRRAKDWKSEHVIVWESVFGDLPEDHIVIFRNGDKSDLSIENLEAVSRAENMRRNSYLRYGEEIAGLIRMRGVLNRKINSEARHERQS